VMPIRHQASIGAEGGVNRGGWLRFVTASNMIHFVHPYIEADTSIDAVVFMRRCEARSSSKSRGRAENE